MLEDGVSMVYVGIPILLSFFFSLFSTCWEEIAGRRLCSLSLGDFLDFGRAVRCETGFLS